MKYVSLLFFLFISFNNLAQDLLQNIPNNIGVSVLLTPIHDSILRQREKEYCAFNDTMVNFLNNKKAYKNWNSITLVDQVYPKYLNTIRFALQRNKVKVLDSISIVSNRVNKKKIN